MITPGRILPLLSLFFLFTLPTAAQDAGPPVTAAGPDLSVQLGGLTQVRAAYTRARTTGIERIGFGVRSMRLNLRADAGERVRLFAQGEAAGGTFTLIDIDLGYRLSPHLSLHAGRLIMTQPAGFALTPQSGVDATDRSVTAVEWGGRTIGPDGRDFGVEARLSYPRARFRLAFQNGDGSWDRLRGNFRDDVGTDAAPSADRTGGAVGFGAAVGRGGADGVELGGYAGYSTARGPNTALAGVGRSYTTAAMHLYRGAMPGSRRWRVKAEALAVWYEALPAETSGFDAAWRQRLVGASALGAVRLHRAAEVFGRAEWLDLDTPGADDPCSFLTLGASFSPSAWRGLPYARERLTLAWTSRCLTGGLVPVEAYGLTVQAQVVF